MQFVKLNYCYSNTPIDIYYALQADYDDYERQAGFLSVSLLSALFLSAGQCPLCTCSEHRVSSQVKNSPDPLAVC